MPTDKPWTPEDTGEESGTNTPPVSEGVNIQPLLNQLGEIERQLKSCFTDLKQSINHDSSNPDFEKSIKELWNNNHGLNDIFNSIAEIKKSLSTVKGGNISQEQIVAQLNGLKNQISNLKMEPELTQQQINQISTQIGKTIVTTIGELLESINDRLNKIKGDIAQLPQKISNSSTNVAKLDMETEHKTYFTWTAVFAIALILSAIFITRGYLVDFVNPAYLTSVLIIFCISFLATSVFNLVFAIADIDLYTEDPARLAYFIVCGILDGVTFLFSIIVLVL